jgi:hypothetical protein
MVLVKYFTFIFRIKKGKANNSASPSMLRTPRPSAKHPVSRHRNTTQKTGRAQLCCEYQAPWKIGGWLQFRSG